MFGEKNFSQSFLLCVQCKRPQMLRKIAYFYTTEPSIFTFTVALLAIRVIFQNIP